ncbi:hypothetical protein GCM10010329_32080 [Streptomyces spiroverticillatus]|uniref:DNA-binding protein n=2 Tax=Streptomyces finlayi TaxID=67296 RepID=A0A919C9A2_9ACTN|nr:hypothetical protein GCM10010329_32080 [Streptomyces spiroverticillatus]GHC90470.1 hypothetical protein GCM10010334_24490 [Streptomyces finlayi]
MARATIQNMTDSYDGLLPLAGKAHVSTTYADWAAAHDPGTADAARELVDGLYGELSRTWSKPGRFVDAMAVRARRLPPPHLPWFWDTVGHRLFGNGSSGRRAAGRAYAAARAAEAEHALAVVPAYRIANALLFARCGAVPAKELAAHQRFLSDSLPPAEAYTALEEFLLAWTRSPADLPADLVRRVRAAAKPAGHGDAEAARTIGAILAAAREKAVPDALLTAARPLLAAHRPTDDVAAGLLDVFPDGVTDGGAWLRLLDACGASEAMASGRVVPDGGVARWVGHFVRMYQYAAQSGGGVSRQRVPGEFLELIGRLGSRLRASETPVTLHTTRYHWQGFDADVLDACLAAGAEVVDPGAEIRMRFWGAESRRDLAALAADPVFGPRLEGTVHADLLPSRYAARGRRPGSAVTLLPGNEGIAQGVAARVGKLVDTVGGGGMAGAEEAVAELETVLDRPTVSALDGIADALDTAGAAGTLRRSLAAGLPEELAWPALESAYAQLATDEEGPLPGVEGVTSTWPVLTVFGRDRAVAVAPDGERGSCRFTIPDGASMYAVHYVGGSFLVSWTRKPSPYYCDTAVWADRPNEPFTPDECGGLVPFDGSLDGAYGFQFETADGGGRHAGQRVLRPGETSGIDREELQLSDGAHVWTNAVYGRKPWESVHRVTGEPQGARPLPDFPGRAPDPATEADLSLAREALQLAPLPAGLTGSPLGAKDGLVGTRILFRTRHRDHAPDHYRVESIDGRTARFDIDRPGQEPWGLWAAPEGAVEDVVLAESQTRTGVRAYTADGTLLWELDGHTAPHRSRPVNSRRQATVSGGTALPPAFWYLLRTREPAASRALRTVTEHTADALLTAALTDPDSLPLAVKRTLPAVTDPVLVEAVAAVARRAARVETRRRELHRRVALLAAAPPATPRRAAPDTDLVPALHGLVTDGTRDTHRPGPDVSLPATLTALATDGACLAGTVGEEVRRLSPPAPPHDWSQLLGTIDAAAWRAAVAPTPDASRAALLALLDTWAEQPFARRGSRWWTGRTDSPEALDALRAEGAAVASAGMRAGGNQRWYVTAVGTGTAEPLPEARLVHIERDDATRLRALVAAVDTDGPVPLPESAAARFAQLTGVRSGLARLVVAGLVGGPDRDADLALARKAPYKATPQTAETYVFLRNRLGADGRRALLATAMPEDPTELWRPGGIDAAVERMAAVWCERLGARPAVDDTTADALEAGLGLGEVWARRLAGGFDADGAAPVPAVDWELAASAWGAGVEVRAVPPAGPPLPYRTPVGLPYGLIAASLAWAWTDRPVGDPAAAGAYDLHERMRAELARPELLVELRFGKVEGTPEDIAERFGPRRLPVAMDARKKEGPFDVVPYDSGALVVCAPSGAAYLRPALVESPEALRRLGEETGLTDELARLEPLLPGGGLERMMHRARSGTVPDGAYEADPRQSCPDLVARAATHLGTGEDAAALYLQLAALPAPTDRDVRRWNGWTPKRHTEVRAELLATGAVLEAKRARAGRTLFLPGEWTELKAPHLPLETAKLTAYGVRPLWRDQILAPFLRILPVAPLHEVFAGAWEREVESLR